MDKKLFKELIGSVREAGRIARGEVKPARVHDYTATRVKALRSRFKPAKLVKVRHQLKMSQSEFADAMLISKSTLQSWEQGRRAPEGPALVLIQVLSKNPSAVVEALHA